MKTSSILFIFLLLFGCDNTSHRAKQAGEPNKYSLQVVERLKAEEKRYARQLVDSQEYEKVLSKMAEGDDILIRNAYLFKPWVDASTSLALDFTLFRDYQENLRLL